jgi:PhnB protein
MPVSPIPVGYHSVTPYLIVNGAARALPWYVQAFGARELMRLSGPDGRIGHAEIEIGDSHVMLADESLERDAKSPATFGGSPVSLHLYVPDVDATVARAIKAGAELKRPVEDQFYGDRMGTLLDPFGHTWHISTHIKDVTPDEIERRTAELFGKG